MPRRGQEDDDDMGTERPDAKPQSRGTAAAAASNQAPSSPRRHRQTANNASPPSSPRKARQKEQERRDREAKSRASAGRSSDSGGSAAAASETSGNATQEQRDAAAKQNAARGLQMATSRGDVMAAGTPRGATTQVAYSQTPGATPVPGIAESNDNIAYVDEATDGDGVPEQSMAREPSKKEGQVGVGVPHDEKDPNEPIVAHLAVDDTEMAERIAERVQRQMEEQMRRQQEQQQQQIPAHVVPAVKVSGDEDDDNDDSFICGLSFKCFLILGAVGFMGLAAIAAGVVVFMTKEDPVETAVPTLPPSPTEEPTAAPVTPSPTTLEPTIAPTDEIFPPRFETAYSRIGSIIADDPRTLRDTSTKQHWALYWLTEVDQAVLDVETMPEQVLIDRYVMVLFFNVTGGDRTWLNDFGFLSSRSTCGWTETFDEDDERGVICSGPDIEEVILRENGLQGAIPTEIGLLTSLVFFDVTDNFMLGTFPVFFTELPLLERLWLRTNGFNGPIPTEIANMSSLFGLDIATNGFTGTIPTEIGLMPALRGVSLRENFFTGEIPTELGLLSDTLDHLDLYSAQLSGPIPTELGNLRLLAELWLDANDLTGTIPTELGRLTSLTFFRMNSNELSGLVPSELGQLTLVTTLYFYFNPEIRGRLPTEFAQLTRLENFAVHDTALTGGVQETMCDVVSLVQLIPFAQLYADCRGNFPQVECSCCTHCCAAGSCVENS